MKTSRLAQAGFPAVIVLVISVMIVPLPAALLDLLIVANISTAVLILIMSTNVQAGARLLVVPVAAARRHPVRHRPERARPRGDPGQRATPATSIETFGSFVVGGNLVVGFVIFLIITLVQFVVITNGAGRVAEVSARFTLDAMPGKQMAIDADLNAGVHRRRGGQAPPQGRSPTRPTSTVRWTARRSS